MQMRKLYRCRCCNKKSVTPHNSGMCRACSQLLRHHETPEDWTAGLPIRRARIPIYAERAARGAPLFDPPVE